KRTGRISPRAVSNAAAGPSSPRKVCGSSQGRPSSPTGTSRRGTCPSGTGMEVMERGVRGDSCRARERGAGSDDLDRADEAFVAQLDARFLARAAETVDLEAVPGGLEAVLRADPVHDAVHLRALELGHAPALHADQVLVHGMTREPVLVALEALAEIVLLDEPAPHEQVEGAIDGRLADPLAPRADLPL